MPDRNFDGSSSKSLICQLYLSVLVGGAHFSEHKSCKGCAMFCAVLAQGALPCAKVK